MAKVNPVVPDAYIMARIVLNPSKKWMNENPKQIVRYNNGETIPATIRTESSRLMQTECLPFVLRNGARIMEKT